VQRDTIRDLCTSNVIDVWRSLRLLLSQLFVD
jgi:hypothetical protein